LRGLEVLHGVSRNDYTDFIQDLEDHLMPLPDPRMRTWLLAAASRLPTYLFTNARRDWADRCLSHLGLKDLLELGGSPAGRPVLGGILDIDFMEWAGKPNREAFAKVERYLIERHPPASDLIFADDRLDNLAAARARGWRTVWVRPHDASPSIGADHRIVDSLFDLDPETLE
jgi:FMN phosphatase YigB (HAD superfamily)